MRIQDFCDVNGVPQFLWILLPHSAQRVPTCGTVKGGVAKPPANDVMAAILLYVPFFKTSFNMADSFSRVKGF